MGYVFHRRKLNFESIGNSVHAAELLALGGTTSLKQTTYEIKALQVQVYFQNRATFMYNLTFIV